MPVGNRGRYTRANKIEAVTSCQRKCVAVNLACCCSRLSYAAAYNLAKFRKSVWLFEVLCAYRKKVKMQYYILQNKV